MWHPCDNLDGRWRKQTVFMSEDMSEADGLLTCLVHLLTCHMLSLTCLAHVMHRYAQEEEGAVEEEEGEEEGRSRIRSRK